MSEPTYSDALELSQAVADRYRAVNRSEPAPVDIAHNLWRLLREGWSREDILTDIGLAPTPTPRPPRPPRPPTPAPGHENDPAWQQMVRDTIRASFADRAPTPEQLAHAFEMAHAPPRGQGWTHIEIQQYARESTNPAPTPPASDESRVRVDGDVFRYPDGRIFYWQGATMFLLFRRWLNGENISDSIEWMRLTGVNVARVLCMVSWSGLSFGPKTHPRYYEELYRFARELSAYGIRVELVAFADAQDGMPHLDDQRAHFRAVVGVADSLGNAFVEVCNEPFKNGVDTVRASDGIESLSPVALGDYTFTTSQRDGLWHASLPVRDYVTLHTPRDLHAWARKAKDLHEMREGSGDGLYEGTAIFPGTHCPVIDDEPLGAAEASNVPGKQRSANPDEHFWHHAVAAMFCAGTTIHFDDGLMGRPPNPAGGDQQRCADAISRVWTFMPAEAQAWAYTRSGLIECPLEYDPQLFPAQTSRIYAKIGGNKAVAVAVHPMAGWQARATDGWRIVDATGPGNSLVYLER